MAKITRTTLKVFGGSGANTYFAQFGSQAASAPVKTKNVSSIQQLTAWVDGFQDALTLSKAPYLEDMNSVLYVHSTQTAYILQEGIAEWDNGTTYYTNSIVKRSGTTELYGSLIDNNLSNPLPISTSNANWRFLNPTQQTVPVVGNALKANLTLQPNTGAPNNKIDIAADLLSVQGTVLTTVAQTVDMTVSGAGGLDTGVEQASKWYAVFIISNNTGSLVSSLLSLSATAPTLPGGYTLFRRVGWIRNNASSNYLQQIRIGDDVAYFDPEVTAQSFPAGVTSWATVVPPTSRSADFQGNAGSASINTTINLRTPGQLSFITLCDSAPATNARSAGHGRMLLDASQQLDINITADVGAQLRVFSYRDVV